MASESSASYWEVPIKCTVCGLHYNVLTWSEDWAEKTALGGFCPECGQLGSKVVYDARKMDGFIFNSVPGGQTLVEITDSAGGIFGQGKSE